MTHFVLPTGGTDHQHTVQRVICDMWSIAACMRSPDAMNVDNLRDRVPHDARLEN